MINRFVLKKKKFSRGFSFEAMHGRMDKRMKFVRELEKVNLKYQRRCRKIT